MLYLIAEFADLLDFISGLLDLLERGTCRQVAYLGFGCLLNPENLFERAFRARLVRADSFEGLTQHQIYLCGVLTIAIHNELIFAD